MAFFINLIDLFKRFLSHIMNFRIKEFVFLYNFLLIKVIYKNVAYIRGKTIDYIQIKCI